MWCVWTCQGTRGQVAQMLKTTASRGRWPESTRFVWDSQVVVSVNRQPDVHICVLHLYHQATQNQWKLLFLLTEIVSVALFLSLCSLCRVSVWIKDPSTWSGHLWVGTLQDCLLLLTPLICAASPWCARQVKPEDVWCSNCLLEQV